MRRARFFVLLALGACGSRSGLHDDSSSEWSTSADAPVLSAICPKTIPSIDGEDGGACLDEGFMCELDDDNDPLCNRLWACTSGRWMGALPSAKHAATCPTPIGYGIDPGCPAGRAEITAWGDCATEGLFCPFSEGNCGCNRGHWLCNPYAPSCTRHRPRLGSTCPTNLAICGYWSGRCSHLTEIGQYCQDGFWQGNYIESCE